MSVESESDAWRKLPKAIAGEWRKTPYIIRALGTISFSLGLVLALLGLLGDLLNLWSRFPFLTNLASSVTGALFGIPLAVVFLQRLSALQSDSFERIAVREDGRRAARKLSKAVQAVVGGGFELTELRAEQDRAYEVGPNTVEALDVLISAALPPGRIHSPRAKTLSTYLHSVSHTLNELVGMLDHEQDIEQAWDEAHVTAMYLHDQIKPRYLRIFESWISVSLDRQLIGPFSYRDSRFPYKLASALQDGRVRAIIDRPEDVTDADVEHAKAALKSVKEHLKLFAEYLSWRRTIVDLALQIEREVNAI